MSTNTNTSTVTIRVDLSTQLAVLNDQELAREVASLFMPISIVNSAKQVKVERAQDRAWIHLLMPAVLDLGYSPF